ncbi:MAG: gliding motility-associated C-terminal domain-containing protein, partial [Chitinophagales bacterium]|nr:gliding motility-associated C-terminal domain-containing protein [Chitinophagales bacterium]
GCEASSQIESIDVKEFDDDIFVPSAFSPNDDNLNDKFYIVSKNVASAYFAIYNRWGERVFETNDLSRGWDGTHKGELLNPDVFVYYLKGVFYDGESFLKKGNITLIK